MSSLERNIAVHGTPVICCGRGAKRITKTAGDSIFSTTHSDSDLQRIMKPVARPLEPVQHIIEGARAYNSLKGYDDPHASSYGHVRQTVDRIKDLGHHYDALPTYSADAIPHFEAMRKEVNDQYDHLTNRMGVKVQVTDHDPYKNAHEMAHDLRTNRRIQVLGTHTTGAHPFFSDDENDRFRAVHDAFGHAGAGRDFDAHGEEAAWHAHSRMFSPQARGAMTSETRGQNGSVIMHSDFGPQKVALLPKRFWGGDLQHQGSMVDDYRDARREQDERIEQHTHFSPSDTSREEVRAFSGDPNVARADHSERRITFKNWLQSNKGRGTESGPQSSFNNGYELGYNHGESFHPEHLEAQAGEHSEAFSKASHPADFQRGYSHGWGSAVESDSRYAVLQSADDFVGVPGTLRYVAHVSGNQVDLAHCPFCGSGSIIARSDGTVECSYCTAVFTVQVQPQFAAFPQSVDGQPYPWPGQPDPSGMVTPTPPADVADQVGDDDSDDDSDDDEPMAELADSKKSDPAKKGKDGANPFAKGKGKSKDSDSDKDDDSDDDDKPKGKKKDKKSGNPFAKKKSYLTAAGAELDEDAFVAHLAILHANDPEKVVEAVKGSWDREDS